MCRCSRRRKSRLWRELIGRLWSTDDYVAGWWFCPERVLSWGSVLPCHMRGLCPGGFVLQSTITALWGRQCMNTDLIWSAGVWISRSAHLTQSINYSYLCFYQTHCHVCLYYAVVFLHMMKYVDAHLTSYMPLPWFRFDLIYMLVLHKCWW